MPPKKFKPSYPKGLISAADALKQLREGSIAERIFFENAISKINQNDARQASTSSSVSSIPSVVPSTPIVPSTSFTSNTFSDFSIMSNDQMSISSDDSNPRSDLDLQFSEDETQHSIDIHQLDLDFAQSNYSTNSTVMSKTERYLATLLHQAYFNQSNEELQKMLKLINSVSRHNPDDPPLMETTNLNSMLNKIPELFKPTFHKYFYSSCGSLIGPISNVNIPATCAQACADCQIIPRKVMYGSEACDYFVYISLREWLSYLVPLFYDTLRLSSNASSRAPSHDLYSGSRYRELTLKPNTLTLTIAWDGVDCSRSMWPLVCYLNELPFSKRIVNPMLIAVQYSAKKPKGDLMLQPLIDELVELEDNPIFIEIRGRPTPFYVKLLLVIADAPARATLLRMSGHNSYNPCSMCELHGEYSTKFGVMVYRKPNAGSKVCFRWIERKDEEWRQILETQQYPWKGINGACQLSRLKYIKLPCIAPPEIMHSQFLGTMKLLLERFLFTGVSSKQWYKSFQNKKIFGRVTRIDRKHQDIINARLRAIKFPSAMLKTMPQLGDRFKSMDYEHLLFYGHNCFKGILSKKEFKLLRIFAYIISSLSNRYVSNAKNQNFCLYNFSAFQQICV